MAERSRFWDGSTVGDAVSITDDELMDRFFRALLNGTGNQGVLFGWLNELEVTDGGGLNASVDTGGAILYGLGYSSDAVETVVLPDNSTVWVVVRRDWAVPQARLTQVAARVQNPGVTYDIPLAQVTTLAGIITLITDGRDYCEFPTELQDNSVETDHIQDSAVTTAKLEDQVRSLSRGAGELIADVANPASWVAHATWPYVPYCDMWAFSTAVSDAVWCTFLVPADISSATMNVYTWTRDPTVSSGDVVWAFSSWDAQSGAVLVNQTGTATETRESSTGAYRTLLGTIAVIAGDIVHIQFYRDGANPADTLNNEAYLHMVEFTYTADS